MSDEQLHAVLIALEGDTAILPNSAVLEVVSREAVDRVPQAPVWLLGILSWQGRSLPVVRLEGLNGVAEGPGSRRSRVVVVQSVGRHWAPARFAILAQGYPHLVTLNRAAMAALPLKVDDRDDMLLARVRIASQEAMVPDLEAVERQLAAWSPEAAAQPRGE